MIREVAYLLESLLHGLSLLGDFIFSAFRKLSQGKR